MDTIFALATAPGRAGVAIVRLSGAKAVEAAGRMMTTVPRQRGVRKIKNDAGDILDEALVLNFENGHSFTGEPVVELHLHGAPVIVSAVLSELDQFPGVRRADPGEFTRRALVNGKLDLSQVEGLADLIDAETEAQRRQAMRVFAGGLGNLAEDWRRRIIRAAALVEATIDFVDEDVPVDVYPEVRELIAGVEQELTQECEGVKAAEIIRDGFEIAIVGAPNAGKSTLLNRLAGRDAAITSDIAGTTRDVIEVRMDVGGFAVTFLDTAGLRDTDDTVEAIGISRAVQRAESADMRIFLMQDSQGLPIDPHDGDLVLVAKADDAKSLDEGVSGKTGAGVDLLLDHLETVLLSKTQRSGVAMRARHESAMRDAIAGLERADVMIDEEIPADLIAEELRLSVGAIDMIVGRIDVEDLLDEIFSSFCIGK